MNTPLEPSTAVDMDEWLDALPVGTYVAMAELDRLAWPINETDSRSWVMVSCDRTFCEERYARWLLALPVAGVMADPADVRYRAFLAKRFAAAVPA